MTTQTTQNASPKKPPQVVSMFGGQLKDKKVSEKGTQCNAGKYTVKVTKVVMKDKVRKTGAPAYIVEFDILKSSRPAEIPRYPSESSEEYELRLKKAPNAVGTSATWFQNLADQDVGLGALKGFAAGITGSDWRDPEFVEDVESFLTQTVKGEPDEDGHFIEGAPSVILGWVLPLEVVEIMTKPSKEFPVGHPFGVYKFGAKIEEEVV